MNCIINYPASDWSTSYLIEQIYFELISIREEDGVTLKYEKRSKWLNRRIPLFEISLPFIIYTKDLSERVKKEIVEIGEANYEYMKSLVKKSIEMIFMGLDETEEPIFDKRHYLLSIKPYHQLDWRFDTKDDKINDLDSKYDIIYPEYNSKGNAIGKVKTMENKIIKEVNNIL